MLPGFRFVFAAIMLSMSLLIFGLGATALFRAAHESFASNSSWRAAPEVPFAQRPDTTLPVLATLRVDAFPIEKANDQATVNAAAAQLPEPIAAESIKDDQVAAVRPFETPPAETAKPVELPAPVAELPPPAPVAKTPPVAEAASPTMASAAPVAAETTTVADERQMTTAAVSDATSVRSQPTKSEPASEPAPQSMASASTPAAATVETAAATVTPPADSLAATKIATLGGPPVDVSDDWPAIELREVKLPRARPDQSAIKKRVQARRAMHRRRLMRARLLFQQQQANPFGQPQPFPPPTAPPIPR